jgi:hypothetical protein
MCHDHKTWTSDNWKRARDMVRWVALHAVSYIRKSLRLENAQGSLQSGMTGSNCETRGRFCDVLSSNITVQYSVGPIITLHGRITAREYVDRLDNRAHPVIQTRTTMQFSKTTMPPFVQLELFSHGFNSMKVNFSIFSGQHTHQILT